MVKKQEKGGAAEIAIAPIVASGLLATASKLYRDMVEEQKKVRRGGNAEVEAYSSAVDKFAPVQDGGKKRKVRKSRKHGGFEEVAEEQVLSLEQDGGKKKPKARKSRKHGGFEEAAEEQQALNVELEQEGGKKKRKARKSRKHGGFEEAVEEKSLALEEVSQEQEGGAKKRKARKGRKHGGFEEAVEELQDVLMGGKKKRTYRKKKGGDGEMDAPGFPPTGEPAAVVDPAASPMEMQGGAKKRKAPRKSTKAKRGGNAELLGLYESQLGGIASKLNELVRG